MKLILKGAKWIYDKYVEPFLQKHQMKIDEEISKIGKRASTFVSGIGKKALNSLIAQKDVQDLTKKATETIVNAVVEEQTQKLLKEKKDE